jgi:hypothetical protein
MLSALLFFLAGVFAAGSEAADYPCPAPFGPAQAACTFTSTGGTTTYTVNVSAQAWHPPPPDDKTPDIKVDGGFALDVTLNGLPCNANYEVPTFVLAKDENYHFPRSINATCTFDVESGRPVELVAVMLYFNMQPLYMNVAAQSVGFVPDNTLGVTLAGAGSGTVVSSDGRISCGDDCTETYSPAATITLTALPAMGSAFAGWSGACSGSAPACTLRMSETRSVGATFVIANPARIVEFYNGELDHYFVTGNADEAAAIDRGDEGPGWSRTGLLFKAGGAVPVCRFYGSVSPGPNSHFYTAQAAECNALKSLQAATPGDVPRWNYEGIAFGMTLPVNGLCPLLTVPVYRAYNNGFALGKDSNHRLTTSANALQEVVARGWKYEGIAMCAPE